MGLFSDITKYGGYEIYEDKENRIWIIRTPGPYGIKVGQADSLKSAKKLVDAIK